MMFLVAYSCRAGALVRRVSSGEARRSSAHKGRRELPKGYVVALIRITDAGQYSRYRSFAANAIKAHRGRVLVRSASNEAMEGAARGRTVLQQPNLDAYRAGKDSTDKK
ncbi:DUF1330 domain-containing protein [Paraburkholderia caribensis]|uniref:DUF1330 domain-containing protein n=1 Tax=Paraburkholderia caribensis TaxID=75105 RepID=UPI0034D354AD